MFWSEGLRTWNDRAVLQGVETLDQLDFSFKPSIKRERIESLHELGFLERAENVILLGPPEWARYPWFPSC